MTWWQHQPRDALRGYCWLKIGIQMPRELLYQKINQRVEAMFQGGFLEEVREIAREISQRVPCVQGYRISTNSRIT